MRRGRVGRGRRGGDLWMNGFGVRVIRGMGTFILSA